MPPRSLWADEIPASVFKAALASISPKISDRSLLALGAHFLAPNHTITATDLALTVGLSTYRGINAEYGRLGSLLRSVSPVLAALDGQKSHAIAAFQRPSSRSGNWHLIMHAGLVEAITELGWFETDDVAVTPRDIHGGTALEGETRYRLTIHRRRERALRFVKLQRVRESNPDGKLVCQVPRCEFSFEATYGAIGYDYAEVHHIKPLASVRPNTTTTLDDLIVVCSNCHSMIHRGGDCREVVSLIPKVSRERRLTE